VMFLRIDYSNNCQVKYGISKTKITKMLKVCLLLKQGFEDCWMAILEGRLARFCGVRNLPLVVVALTHVFDRCMCAYWEHMKIIGSQETCWSQSTQYAMQCLLELTTLTISKWSMEAPRWRLNQDAEDPRWRLNQDAEDKGKDIKYMHDSRETYT
jgi:hypothetical protein